MLVSWPIHSNQLAVDDSVIKTTNGVKNGVPLSSEEMKVEETAVVLLLLCAACLRSRTHNCRCGEVCIHLYRHAHTL